MERVWAIRVGNPEIHRTYYIANAFFSSKADALAYKRSNKFWARMNHWKIVQLVEKK